MISILLLVSVFIPIKAETEEPKAQVPTQQEIMTMMAPMMGTMMEAMFETMFNIMAKPKTAERLATFTKNYYDALIAKGFSKEDAIKIVTSMGIPSMPAIK